MELKENVLVFCKDRRLEDIFDAGGTTSVKRERLCRKERQAAFKNQKGMGSKVEVEIDWLLVGGEFLFYGAQGVNNTYFSCFIAYTQKLRNSRWASIPALSEEAHHHLCRTWKEVNQNLSISKLQAA